MNTYPTQMLNADYETTPTAMDPPTATVGISGEF